MAASTAEIVTLTEELCRACGLELQGVESEQVDAGTVRLNLRTAGASPLTAPTDAPLFALQHLLRLLLKKHLGDGATHVVVDADGYRSGQERDITGVAREVAQQVRDTGVPYEFPPMLSYKRRAIHTAFTDPTFGDLHAYSVGEGLRRRVRVERRVTSADLTGAGLP